MQFTVNSLQLTVKRAAVFLLLAVGCPLSAFGQSTLTVPHGGSGLATTATYGLIFGGTTSTGALQQIGTGTTGQLLLSGGAGVLPSWGTIIGGGVKVYSNTSTTGNTVASTASETAFTSTYTIPAGTVVAGDVFAVDLWGYYSTAVVPPTLTMKVKVGSTTVLNSGAITTIGSISNAGWHGKFILSFFTVGSSGTCDAQAMGWLATAATTSLSVSVANTSQSTINTTIDEAITVTITWGTSNASNTVTLSDMVINNLRAQGTGTPVSVANGGTGLTALTAHYGLLGNGTSAPTLVVPGTATYVWTSNGASSDPTWQAASGGGLSGLTNNGHVYATGSTTVTSTAAGTDGQILISATGAAPTLATLTGGTGITITNATNAITVATFQKKYTVTVLSDSNTSSAVAILSVSIPANEFADGDRLDFDWLALIKNNSGGTLTFTPSFFWGANSNGSTAISQTASTSIFRVPKGLTVMRIGSDIWWALVPFSNSYTADNFAGASGNVLTGQSFSGTTTLAFKMTCSGASGEMYYSVPTSSVHLIKRDHN